MHALDGALTAVNLATGHFAPATTTIAGLDIRDFVGTMKLIMSYKALAGSGTLTVSLKDSADNTTFAALASPTFAAVTTEGQASISFDTTLSRRYLQVAYTNEGTATYTLAVTGVGTKQVQ